MPYNLPFFPFYNNYRPRPINSINQSHYTNSGSNFRNNERFEANFSYKKNNDPNIEAVFDAKKDSENTESSESFFEIFGIKLYFDDILIICILYFLYNEKVKDEGLFLCLILLLLS